MYERFLFSTISTNAIIIFFTSLLFLLLFVTSINISINNVLVPERFGLGPGLLLGQVLFVLCVVYPSLPAKKLIIIGERKRELAPPLILVGHLRLTRDGQRFFFAFIIEVQKLLGNYECA